MSLPNSIIAAFKGSTFSLQDAYAMFYPKYPKETIRARIYERLGKAFRKIGRGVYAVEDNDEKAILIEGDGRKLSFLKDNSVDCIITDHPWSDPKANKGGNRNFASYDTFKYTVEDFKEKARILKDGCFLVEMLPSETETNYEYLYQIKKMAEEAGFQYYAKVPWKKGTQVNNTGRKSKNTEDMMIFSLGKARNLRPDAKKDKAEPSVRHYMSGANGMLPTEFDVQPTEKKDKLHQSEKPVKLVEQLLDFFTLEGELVVDQFAGSGVVGQACINKNRLCILIEYCKEFVDKIASRLNMQPLMICEEEESA